jgi:hypothetical protein
MTNNLLTVSYETMKAANPNIEGGLKLKSAAEIEKEEKLKYANIRTDKDVPAWLVTFRNSGGSL